jgi:ferredoxin--NADP+ reductase
VGWYNSHPDYTDLTFDIMTAKRAAVVGNGNVAVDVARILATPVEELAKTDIADYALGALRVSPLEKIYMLGRRGPAQAAFTNPELKELGKIKVTDIIVAPEELELDPYSQAALATDKEAAKNVETLRQFAARGPQGQPHQLILRFLVSPVEITGENGHVAALKLERNELRPTESGTLQAHGTGVYEILPVDIVFRAVGYKGAPIPGVPYDARTGTIPNRNGRVVDPATGNPISGEYVVGWAKRGPTGVIGTNKPDSIETARALLEDVAKLQPVDAANAKPEAFESFIKSRQPNVVTYKEWQLLDQLEQQKGAPHGRPRVKFNRVEEMLKALGKTNRAPDHGARGETEEPKSKSMS